MREAEKLVEAGVQELLVISQDTSAYGVDWKGGERPSEKPITTLARDLAVLGHGCGFIISIPIRMCAN